MMTDANNRFAWHDINTVLLDMDGTILDLHFDNFFWVQQIPRLYAEKNNLCESDAIAYLTPIFKLHEGTLNWYSVDFWQAQLDLDIMYHKRQAADRIGFRDDAQAFLKECQNQVDDVRLVTNGHRKVLDLKIERTGLDQYFQQLVCSHELGVPKEDTRFWDRLQKQKPFDPKHTLFIDDSERVLESAQSWGIRYLYSIAQPDSTLARTHISQFPMLDEFRSTSPIG